MSLFVEIEKQLGNFHLDVRFQAETETLALLGASGCGKSMTLKCIAGIMTPDRGRIVLNGRVELVPSLQLKMPLIIFSYLFPPYFQLLNKKSPSIEDDKVAVPPQVYY